MSTRSTSAHHGSVPYALAITLGGALTSAAPTVDDDKDKYAAFVRRIVSHADYHSDDAQVMRANKTFLASMVNSIDVRALADVCLSMPFEFSLSIMECLASNSPSVLEDQTTLSLAAADCSSPAVESNDGRAANGNDCCAANNGRAANIAYCAASNACCAASNGPGPASNACNCAASNGLAMLRGQLQFMLRQQP